MLLDIPQPLTRHRSRIGSVLVLSLHADPTTAVGAPENGGVTVYVRELIRALVAEGWSVDLVTRRQSPADAQRETRYGAQIVRIDAGPLQPLANDAIAQYLPAAAQAVRELAVSRMYRFISSHYWLSGVVGQQIADGFGIPHVHTLHSHGIERKRRDEITLRRIEAERELLRTAHIVTLSASHIAVFRRRYGVDAPVQVVPAGIDTERFRPADPAVARRALGLHVSRPWIGYVGRLAREKGIDDLLYAFALLHARRPDAGLFVVGGAAARSRIPELQRLSNELNVANNVRFLGPIPNHGVERAFQAADVLAIPSHYEAFGLVAIEARATGTPIVASDVGGLRDLVTPESGGVRVPPHDYVSWASALEDALRPQTLSVRRALALGSSDALESWRSIAQRISAVALEGAHA